MNIQLIFESVMLVQIFVGFFCAYKMGPQIHVVMRWLILSPCIMSLFAIFGDFVGQYTAHVEDITYALANIAIYIILASLLAQNKWKITVKNESTLNY